MGWFLLAGGCDSVAFMNRRNGFTAPMPSPDHNPLQKTGYQDEKCADTLPRSTEEAVCGNPDGESRCLTYD
jgi:hypothetical protein